MWWCSTIPPSELSPRTRATRLARPGADSAVRLSMPPRVSTSARKRAPAISLPGGLVVSIARYARKSSTASSPMARQSSVPGIALLGARGAARRRLAAVDVRAGGRAGGERLFGRLRVAAGDQPLVRELPARRQRLARAGDRRLAEGQEVGEARPVFARRLRELRWDRRRRRRSWREGQRDECERACDPPPAHGGHLTALVT